MLVPLLKEALAARPNMSASRRYFLQQAISTAHTIGGRTSRSTAREARKLILVRGYMISSSMLGLRRRLKGPR
jgi:hypothetical protein